MIKTPTRIAMVAALAAAFLAAGGRDHGGATGAPGKDATPAAEIRGPVAPDPISHTQLASNFTAGPLHVRR